MTKNPKECNGTIENGIKPCPFCGAEIHGVSETHTPDYSFFYVWCPKCCSSSGHYNHFNEAIKFWNKRHDNSSISITKSRRQIP